MSFSSLPGDYRFLAAPVAGPVTHQRCLAAVTFRRHRFRGNYIAMSSTSEPNVQERYQLIAQLPRPRPLRRSPIASFAAVLIINLLKLVALGFAANILWSLREFTSLSAFSTAHKSSFFALGFVGLAMFVVTMGQRQQKNLVANGEVAIATVTGRYYLNPYWHVNYEFEDKNGQHINNEAMDKTGKEFLIKGQQIFVYYSAANPRKAVAQSDSWYEPSIRGMGPDPRF